MENVRSNLVSPQRKRAELRERAKVVRALEAVMSKSRGDRDEAARARKRLAEESARMAQLANELGEGAAELSHAKRARVSSRRRRRGSRRRFVRLEEEEAKAPCASPSRIPRLRKGKEGEDAGLAYRKRPKTPTQLRPPKEAREDKPVAGDRLGDKIRALAAADDSEDDDGAAGPAEAAADARAGEVTSPPAVAAALGQYLKAKNRRVSVQQEEADIQQARRVVNRVRMLNEMMEQAVGEEGEEEGAEEEENDQKIAAWVEALSQRAHVVRPPAGDALARVAAAVAAPGLPFAWSAIGALLPPAPVFAREGVTVADGFAGLFRQ